MTSIALVLVVGLAAQGTTPAPAAQAAPGSPSAALAEAYFLFMQGRSLESAGDVTGALAAFRRALELVPKSGELHAELAGLHARQGRANESIAAANAALALEPDNREAHRILGLVQSSLASRTPDPANARSMRLQAIGHLEQSLAGGVRDPLAELSLGRLLVEVESFQKAADRLQLFLLDQPGYPEALALLGTAYDELGQAAEAAAIVEQIVQAQPDQTQARLWLAQLYEKAERWKDAAAAWADLAGRSSRPATLRSRQASALISGGDYAGAIAILEPLVTNPADTLVSSGTYARMAADLATAIEKSGDRARATKLLEDARVRDAKSDAVRFGLAGLYERDNQFDRAEALLREVVAAEPANAGALNYLGYMLADRGQKLPEALDLIKRALAIEAENPSFLDSLGWVYVKQARLDLAREPLERAATALPKVSVIQDHLGELYFQLKRYRDAQGAWDRALAGDRDGIDVTAITRKRDRAKDLAGKFAGPIGR